MRDDGPDPKTPLEAWGPILGVLFNDGSSDFVLNILRIAGVPVDDFNLDQRESYSHSTRKRAYQIRLGSLYAKWNAETRLRVSENIASQLLKYKAYLTDVSDALARVGWEVREGRLVRLDSNETTTMSTITEPGFRKLRVFLCHSKGDKQVVRELYQRLINDSFEPWLDEEDLIPGQNWEKAIRDAVRNSDAVLVCLSQQATTKKGYLHKEIKIALDEADKQPEGTIFIIPVKLEECSVPERLSRWQWVDLFYKRGYVKLYNSLTQRCEALKLPPSEETRSLGVIRINSKDFPKVLISCSRDLSGLQVESLHLEAINLRLVPAESRNYYLRSEIIRCLRVGKPEILVLRSEPKRKSGSPVLQRFASPSLFFNDSLPVYDGKDERGALEHSLEMVAERQPAVDLELAYSGFSGADHYRGKFRVRWDSLSKSINDVEHLGFYTDSDPPSTLPLNVIAAPPSDRPRLEFQIWHAGSERGFPNRWADGTPTWLAVRNTQIAPARKATNVRARLTFIDSQRRSRFVVEEAIWYQPTGDRSPTGDRPGRWTRNVAIDGGDEQSFVFYVTDDQGQPTLFSTSGDRLGGLSHDRWNVEIAVTADNAEGFRGNIGFTYTINELSPDPRGFVCLEALEPLVEQS